MPNWPAVQPVDKKHNTVQLEPIVTRSAIPVSGTEHFYGRDLRSFWLLNCSVHLMLGASGQVTTEKLRKHEIDFI